MTNEQYYSIMAVLCFIASWVVLPGIASILFMVASICSLILAIISMFNSDGLA